MPDITVNLPSVLISELDEQVALGLARERGSVVRMAVAQARLTRIGTIAGLENRTTTRQPGVDIATAPDQVVQLWRVSGGPKPGEEDRHLQRSFLVRVHEGPDYDYEQSLADQRAAAYSYAESISVQHKAAWVQVEWRWLPDDLRRSQPAEH